MEAVPNSPTVWLSLPSNQRGFPTLHVHVSWDVRSRSMTLIISPKESQYVHPLPRKPYPNRLSTGSLLSSEHRDKYLKWRSRSFICSLTTRSASSRAFYWHRSIEDIRSMSLTSRTCRNVFNVQRTFSLCISFSNTMSLSEFRRLSRRLETSLSFWVP